MVKVSIITPCYNAEKFIGKAIESVRGQTFTDWEHIIVDDDRQGDFGKEAKNLINNWKDKKKLNSEQKKQVDQAIFFYEKRLVPLVAMMSANQLITERKILPALNLYFQAAKSYLL